MKTRHIRILLLAGVAALAGGRASAAVLAYEGFDYAANSTIGSQSGGTGWRSQWVIQAGGGANTIVGSSLISGNAGYNLGSTGNSANVFNNVRVGRTLDVLSTGNFGSNGYLDGNGNIGADGTTMYLSFLMSETTNTAGNGYFELVFSRDDLGDSGRIGGIGDDQPGAFVNLRTAATQTAITGRDTLTHLYVVRFDFLAGNDQMTVWVDPSGSSEPAVSNLQVTDSDMSFDGLTFATFNDNNSANIDEIRLTSTYAEALAVPEPGSSVLFGFAATALLFSRRRSR